MVTKEFLIAEFKKLGLVPGMEVLVHSSLSSFGYVEGGADSVIDALLTCLGPEGTLMMPSFNHGDFVVDGIVFDVHKTPSKSGKITDTFWRRDGVYRSLAATHPFAAAGKNAVAFLENHAETSPMGVGSPIDLLRRAGGYVLLLGVNYTTNSFHHHVEELEGAPCIPLSEPYPIKGYDGGIVYASPWRWRASACPYTDTDLLQKYTSAYTADVDAVAQTAYIGDAFCRLYKMDDVYPLIADYLQKGRNGFPPCKYCTIRPMRNWY